ncbi:hypothetical protein [Candidatus Bathycorpusculum sp.]|uniref:hypothetical protein n=1 Tax=Candidatus Bathycorpusculum sp. TaxID=2994959 RepID=UPI00281E2EA4|nr:hypothetical protein [Candidatus Termitimicrobium sp.]MCL2685684.1 hypothetical protein [Candidatus Termitimicrobium sp.]
MYCEINGLIKEMAKIIREKKPHNIINFLKSLNLWAVGAVCILGSALGRLLIKISGSTDVMYKQAANKKTGCFPMAAAIAPPIMGEKTYPKATEADHKPNVCMVFSGGVDLMMNMQIEVLPKKVPYRIIGSHS